MVGSCRVRLLHIIHVSAVFEVGVLQRKLRQLLRQHVPHCNFKLKLKLLPGLAAVTRLLRAGVSPCKCSCRIPMFLFFGAAVAPQSCCSHGACRVPCKRSLIHHKVQSVCMILGMYLNSYLSTIQQHLMEFYLVKFSSNFQHSPVICSTNYPG